MSRTLRSFVFLFWGALAVMWVLQFGGCAQVDRLKATVQDNIAYERGNQALADNKPAEAAAQYRIAADAGHAQAQYNLGLMTASGNGAAKNRAQALKWMRMSAEGGHPPAQQLLGTWYLAGATAPYDPAEAAMWFGKAADQKDASAMFFLGAMHSRGEGVGKDQDAALAWFRQAADNGFPVPAEYLTPAGVAALGKKTPGSRPATAQVSAAATADRQALVKDIQAGLAAIGYSPGPADGLMGKKTANAIAAFQKDAGLPVDGSPSEALLGHINSRLKK